MPPLEEGPEIQQLGSGRYAFWAGRHKYTISTTLDEQSFKRDVESVRALIDMFPQNLSQDERLFLSLMALTHQMQELGLRAEEISKKFEGGGASD